MKSFTVYMRPDEQRSQENTVFVPEGFSFLLFIPLLNIILLAQRRCWLLLSVVIGIEVASYFASLNEFWSQPLIAGLEIWKLHMVVRFVLVCFLGMWVNDFWRAKLEKRGYEMVGIATAKSRFGALADAELRYFDKHAAN